MAHSTTDPDDGTDPFADCELGPEAILGERTFSGRLYSPAKAKDVMNVNVRTDEPAHDIPSADAIEEWIAEKNTESRRKAAEKSWHDHTDYVALVAADSEMLAESGSLVSYAAFFHMAVTNYEYHFAYLAAVESTYYAVTHEADYETGTITITVEEADIE